MSTFAFTGPATVHGVPVVRENLVALADQQGHRVVSSVSRGTDYLVTDTPKSGSRKNRAAAQHGTRLITPDEFVRMCGGKVPLRARDLA